MVMTKMKRRMVTPAPTYTRIEWTKERPENQYDNHNLIIIIINFTDLNLLCSANRKIQVAGERMRR